MKKKVVFLLIFAGLIGKIISKNEQKLDDKLNRNKRVREVIYDLLELNTRTRMCGDILLYSLVMFCSHFIEDEGSLKFRYKRQNEKYGITDECCYNWCTGYDVLKYCF